MAAPGGQEGDSSTKSPSHHHGNSLSNAGTLHVTQNCPSQAGFQAPNLSSTDSIRTSSSKCSSRSKRSNSSSSSSSCHVHDQTASTSSGGSDQGSGLASTRHASFGIETASNSQLAEPPLEDICASGQELETIS